jgi:hypothetical protein
MTPPYNQPFASTEAKRVAARALLLVAVSVVILPHLDHTTVTPHKATTRIGDWIY